MNQESNPHPRVAIPIPNRDMGIVTPERVLQGLAALYLTLNISTFYIAIYTSK